MTIEHLPPPPHSPLVKYFVEQLHDAPPGPVGLVTDLPHGPVIIAFMFACKLMDRYGVVLRPREIHRKAACVEFARVLLDDRPDFVGIDSHGIAVLTSRMRAEGSGPDEIKWVTVPW